MRTLLAGKPVAVAKAQKECGLPITDEQIAELKANLETINFEDADTVSGWVRTSGPDHTVYFVAELSEPAGSVATFEGGVHRVQRGGAGLFGDQADRAEMHQLRLGYGVDIDVFGAEAGAGVAVEQEFALGVGFAYATPGPVLILAPFIGYRVAGLAGALAIFSILKVALGGA